MSAKPGPLAHQTIRKAIALLLLDDDLDGVLCSFEKLAPLLEEFSGGCAHDDLAEVDVKLLSGAFKCGEREFVCPYSDMHIEGGADDGRVHHLFVRNALANRKENYFEIARITTDDGEDLTVGDDRIPSPGMVNRQTHPLYRTDRQGKTLSLPKEVRDELVEYRRGVLTKRKSRRGSNAKSNAKNKMAKAKKDAAKERKRIDMALSRAMKKARLP